MIVAYLIETWDKPGSAALRAKTREEHLRFLDRHVDILLACGAKLREDGTATGGIYLVALESKIAAESFIFEDPFSKVDLFASVSVTKWRKAYFNGQRLLRE